MFFLATFSLRKIFWNDEREDSSGWNSFALRNFVASLRIFAVSFDFIILNRFPINFQFISSKNSMHFLWKFSEMTIGTIWAVGIRLLCGTLWLLCGSLRLALTFIILNRFQINFQFNLIWKYKVSLMKIFWNDERDDSSGWNSFALRNFVSSLCFFAVSFDFYNFE